MGARLFDALPTADRDFREIRECANRVARLVRDQGTLSPAAYQELVGSMKWLARLWRTHTSSFAEAAASARLEDRHLSIFIAQLDRDSSALADQLESLVAAGWPRTTGLGLSAIRLRAPELLAAMFRQIEKERSIQQALVQQKALPGEEAETMSSTVSSIPS